MLLASVSVTEGIYHRQPVSSMLFFYIANVQLSSQQMIFCLNFPWASLSLIECVEGREIVRPSRRPSTNYPLLDIWF